MRGHSIRQRGHARMISIMLADDHQLIREGMKKVLRDETDMKITAEAGNGTEVMKILRSSPVDVVILDVNMPGRSGIDILGELRKEFPKTAVLVLSIHPEDVLAVRALQAGALGYITKDSSPDLIVKAIRKVASGKHFISERLAERLAENITAGPEEIPHKKLSDREYEVFQLIGSGKTVSEIADSLSLSVPTISTYRARILEKMNMKTNSEIIHYAIKHRINE